MTKTPIKAIRAKCLDCGAGSYKEVRLCPVRGCSLYPYRLGHRPNRHEFPQALRPLKAIRAKCVDCAETRTIIRDCPILDCALQSYRMGKRPRQVLILKAG